MPVTVVIYDAESVLPPTFAKDAVLGRDVALVRDVAEAHRLGRPAEVLVIVGGRDDAGAMGLLTSSAEVRRRAVLLYLADARHQRRLMIHGARRGAAIMIGESAASLAACLRDLVARPPFRGRPTTYRALSPATSPAELCLRILVARRSRRRRRRRVS